MSEDVRPPRPRVVLVGAPGAGKSVVGRAVAQRLGVGFVDTDQLVERAAGTSVSDIFVTAGEPAFRAMEEQAVAEALATQTGVVALGGGAVTNERTRALLADHCVVWLRVSLSDAAHRVGLGASRPLLAGNVRTRLLTLMQEREVWYAEVSTATVDTSGSSVADVVSRVLAAIEPEAR